MAHGLTLSMVITATMNVSGGHINPAVTIGLWSIGRCSSRQTVLFVVSQMIGAALAGFALYKLFPQEAAQAVHYGAPVLAEGLQYKVAFMLEGIATGILTMAIYGTAVSENKPQGIGGFGIGLIVGVLILAIGPLTGAAMNPARHFGSALFGGQLGQHWLYWVGPALGFQICSRVLEDEADATKNA